MKHTIVILFTILFSSCFHSHDSHDHGEEEKTENKAKDELELNAIQIKNIGLKYGKVTNRNINSVLKLTGRIEMPSSGKAIVGAKLSGQVVKVHVKAGDQVKKGQTIYTLENLDIIEWQEDLQQAQADLTYINKEVQRQKELSDQSLAPLKKYEMAIAQQRKMQINIKAKRSKLQSLGLQSADLQSFRSTYAIKAPANGMIQHLLGSVGEYVDATTHLAEIVNNDHLHLHLLAYGAEVSLLQKGQKIVFFIQSRPEKLLDAEVKWINSIVDENKNSYDVHAEIIGNLKGLIAGEFIEARIINQERKVATLPLAAITSDKGINYIFIKEEVHEDGTHFKKIKIMTGEKDLGYVEVKSIDPVTDDMDIVIEGAFFLMAESKKDEGGGGHHH
ncbi:MAG: efflux RND transporter periplasmic adaptor subunit [Saprospiraceae bacterium]